ncbi:hypothetical protein D3C80_1244690 [compost metagenome]
MAVAAFQAVIGLQARPFVLGKLQPLVEELLARIDGAENLAPDLLGGLHLAGDLVRPFMRHMAIRTGGAHAGTVGEMHRPGQFLINIRAHLMTGNAEGFLVGHLKRGVEGAPEHHPADEAAKRQEGKAERTGRRRQNSPEPGEKFFHSGDHHSLPAGLTPISLMS